MEAACGCHDPGFILRLLYGGEDAEHIEAWLAERLTHFTPPPARPINQGDVLLTVDPHQFTRVHKKGLPNLQTILDDLPDGLFSGLHLLPFYAGTSAGASTDTLAVTDPLVVDPALGGWEDIRRLGERFTLAFDAALSTLSTESRAFKAFLDQQPPFDHFFLHKIIGEDGALPIPSQLTRFETAAGPLAVFSTFGEGLADLDYAQAPVFEHALDVLLTCIEHGAQIIRLTDVAHLVKGSGGGLHLPQTHLLVRALRALLDGIAPGVQLVAESGLLFSEPNWYIGNGFNEVHLAQHTPLMDNLEGAVLSGDARQLTQRAAAVALPCDRVSLYHPLPDLGGMTPAQARVQVAAGLALAGVPSVRLDNLLLFGGAIGFRLDGERLHTIEDLLNTRRAQAAFDPHSAQLVLDAGTSVFAVLRISPDLIGQALCLHNFSSDACQVDGELLADACGLAHARDLLTREVIDLQGEVVLPGHAVWWLSGVSPEG